jgi:hypothetical protein
MGTSTIFFQFKHFKITVLGLSPPNITQRNEKPAKLPAILSHAIVLKQVHQAGNNTVLLF